VRMTASGHSKIAPLREGDGEIAGISYRIRGAGPPLVLLPMFLAPSQWEPLVPRLSERYAPSRSAERPSGRWQFWNRAVGRIFADG
jgi:hypothetical protein